MQIHTSRHVQTLTAAAALVLLVCLETGAHADPPLVAGDGPAETESRNKKYVAVPGPGEKSTIVFRVNGTSRQEVWRMPGWNSVSDLSDDGEFLVLGYYRGTLLDLDYKPDVSMLTIYKRGSVVRAVPLKELVRDLTALKRTTSHLNWGAYVGYVDLHRFAVDTVENRRLVYDVTTGQQVSDTASPKPIRQRARPPK